MNQKLAYLANASRKFVAGEGQRCPNCGSSSTNTVDRKYMVTTLERCTECRMLFRTPTTTPEENAVFYQEAYTQGFTTDLPSDEQLQNYLARGFDNSEKDYSLYVNVVKAAANQNQRRLFEFGCSWGYGSYQFAQSGFLVESFEISRPRAAFARDRLGVKVHADLSSVTGPFDVFFSSHVLEHVPCVQDAIDLARRVVAPGGLFVAFTPNGSSEHREADPQSWKKLWGSVHPNFLDTEFYARALGDRTYMTSGPYDLAEISRWQGGKHAARLGGSELLVIARL